MTAFVTGKIDLTDHTLFQENTCIEAFDVLRREAPVYRNPSDEPFWALTTYDNVAYVSKHTDLFISGQGTIINTPAEGSMLSMDDPRHRSLRRLVERGFTARRVRDLEAHTREVCTAILDDVVERGSCDFVESIAAPLPLRVIVEMLGAPQSDADYLRKLGDLMVGHDDPEFNPEGTDERPEQAQQEMFQYFVDLSKDKRRQPRDDLVTALLDAEIDGEKLEELDFLIFCMLLVVAGNETTRNLISHGLLNLFDFPDARARIAADPGLMTSATEEMLRMGSSVMHFRRTATQHTELNGQAIAEGDTLVMWYIAANRDPAYFDDPHAFVPEREPNNHVAFGGGGPHFCLGASLARQEITVLFDELFKRMPDMRLDGEVERLRSNFIRGIKRLPVAFTPSSPRN